MKFLSMGSTETPKVEPLPYCFPLKKDSFGFQNGFLVDSPESVPLEKPFKKHRKPFKHALKQPCLLESKHIFSLPEMGP